MRTVLSRRQWLWRAGGGVAGIGLAYLTGGVFGGGSHAESTTLLAFIRERGLKFTVPRGNFTYIPAKVNYRDIESKALRNGWTLGRVREYMAQAERRISLKVKGEALRLQVFLAYRYDETEPSLAPFEVHIEPQGVIFYIVLSAKAPDSDVAASLIDFEARRMRQIEAIAIRKAVIRDDVNIGWKFEPELYQRALFDDFARKTGKRPLAQALERYGSMPGFLDAFVAARILDRSALRFLAECYWENLCGTAIPDQEAIEEMSESELERELPWLAFYDTLAGAHKLERPRILEAIAERASFDLLVMFDQLSKIFLAQFERR